MRRVWENVWKLLQLFFFSSSVFFFLNKRFKMDPIWIHDFGPAKNKMSNLLLRASRHVALRLVRFFRFIRHTSVRRRESVVEAPPRLIEFSAAKCQTSLKLPSSNDAGSVVLLDRKKLKSFKFDLFKNVFWNSQPCLTQIWTI